MIRRCLLRSIATLSWIVAASLALALETGDPLAERISGIQLGDLSGMREDGVLRVLIPFSFTSPLQLHQLLPRPRQGKGYRG